MITREQKKHVDDYLEIFIYPKQGPLRLNMAARLDRKYAVYLLDPAKENDWVGFTVGAHAHICTKGNAITGYGSAKKTVFVPKGYLPCDGSKYISSDYPDVRLSVRDKRRMSQAQATDSFLEKIADSVKEIVQMHAIPPRGYCVYFADETPLSSKVWETVGRAWLKAGGPNPMCYDNEGMFYNDPRIGHHSLDHLIEPAQKQ